MAASLSELVARHLKIHYRLPKGNLKAALAESKMFADGMKLGFGAEMIADLIAVEKGLERRRDGGKKRAEFDDD